MTTDRLVPWTQYADDHRKAADKAAPLEFINLAEWRGDPPPRRWLVDNVLPEGAVTLLTGHGASGKTICALQLLCSTALNKPWLDLRARPCKALGVFCEDDAAEIERRVTAICRHYDADPGELVEHLCLVSRVGRSNALMEWPDGQFADGELTALYGQVMNAALDFGAELVVLDSLHDLFPGNENHRPAARQFINALRDIAIEIKGAVLLIAHPSRAGIESGSGEAGSTAWHNTVRSRLFLRNTDPERDGSYDRILESRKANYAAPFEPIPLKWSDGAFIAERPATGTVAAIEQGRIEKAFLEALDAANAQGRHLSISPNASNYAPKIIARMPEGQGARNRDLQTAMNRLLAAGEVRNEIYGPPSREKRRLVRKPPELNL